MEDDLVVNQKQANGQDDYYDEDDFDNEQYENDNQGGRGGGQALTLAEEKEALKRKLKEIGNRKKKPPKYKKEPKDILNDLKAPTHTSEEDRVARAERLKSGNSYLNDYNFISTLGTGTFGRVKLVKHRDAPAQDLPLALKCLKKSEIIRLKQIDHVKSEKSILARIDHPFIVNLKGTFQSPTHVFMLLDYACGGELFTLLRREGRFANDVAVFFAVEIILAFEYLHSSDIAYRDLKPENLLIDRDGHVKITDFGFAKEVPDKTYTLCGTPEYLAPEII
jgi:protein kinase A/protein kinase X